MNLGEYALMDGVELASLVRKGDVTPRELAANFGDEATLVRIARDLEEALPWKDRIPPVHASR
jgi:hypothetical protein